jgi:hypothetical protein
VALLLLAAYPLAGNPRKPGSFRRGGARSGRGGGGGGGAGGGGGGGGGGGAEEIGSRRSGKGVSEWVCLGALVVDCSKEGFGSLLRLFCAFFYYSGIGGLVFSYYFSVEWLTPSVSDSNPILFRCRIIAKEFCLVRLG